MSIGLLPSFITWFSIPRFAFLSLAPSLRFSSTPDAFNQPLPPLRHPSASVSLSHVIQSTSFALSPTGFVLHVVESHVPRLPLLVLYYCITTILLYGLRLRLAPSWLSLPLSFSVSFEAYVRMTEPHYAALRRKKGTVAALLLVPLVCVLHSGRARENGGTTRDAFALLLRQKK